MRPICFACRVLLPGCCALMVLVNGCAEGGIDDAELSMPVNAKSKSDAGSRASDARVPGNEAADSIGSKRDAGRSGNVSSASSNSNNRDGGSSASAGAIKCPSPMVCNSSVAALLSTLDSTVKAGQSLCVESGGVLPMAISCETVDECKSARLSTSTCSGGYCIQPCTP